MVQNGFLKNGQATESQMPRMRAVKATAAVIGSAGIVLAAPGAMLVSAGEAQAQSFPDLSSLFGGAGLNPASFAEPAFQVANGFFAIAGAIPVLNIFIGNGADGTAANPNGGNAGLLAGNGGDGFHGTFDSTTNTSTNGGNGGNAGLFFGDEIGRASCRERV